MEDSKEPTTEEVAAEVPVETVEEKKPDAVEEGKADNVETPAAGDGDDEAEKIDEKKDEEKKDEKTEEEETPAATAEIPEKKDEDAEMKDAVPPKEDKKKRKKADATPKANTEKTEEKDEDEEMKEDDPATDKKKRKKATTPKAAAKTAEESEVSEQPSTNKRERRARKSVDSFNPEDFKVVDKTIQIVPGRGTELGALKATRASVEKHANTEDLVTAHKLMFTSRGKVAKKDMLANVLAFSGYLPKIEEGIEKEEQDAIDEECEVRRLILIASSYLDRSVRSAASQY